MSIQTWFAYFPGGKRYVIAATHEEARRLLGDDGSVYAETREEYFARYEANCKRIAAENAARAGVYL